MKHIVPFVLAYFLHVGQATLEKRKLLFVQIIFRHGDRAPLELYPTDPNPASVWPEGLAHLTSLGKKQQYALGEYFRSRYENFTTSSPLEVNVVSSEVDRCLKSAETNMASFYAPDPKWSFNTRLAWQPIAIHYLPKKQDKYLEAHSECPRADKEEQKLLQSPESLKILREHEELFRNLSSNSGYHIANWTKASTLHDTLLIEKKYNLTIPTWIEPYWNELTNVSNHDLFWSFNSPLLHRLRAGPLIERLIKRMNQKINGEIPDLKFQIYSGHDTTIALVLGALNLFNMIAPPYCSSLLFELFEMPDGVKSVRLLYQNSSKPEEKIDPPQVLVLEGCSEFCPLDYFVNYTSALIPKDWDLECQVHKSFVDNIEENKVTIGWFIFLVVAFIAITSIFALWRLYSRRQENNTYYQMPMY